MSETLIVRLPNWLGDTVMAVPALRALRGGLPGTRIVLAGPWAELLRGQDLGDVSVPLGRSWPARLRAAAELRALRPAAALVLPNSFESAASAWYAGARRRVGFDADGRSWLLTEALPVPVPRRHQVDEYAQLAAALGVAVLDRTPRLTPPRDGPEVDEARALLEATAASGRRPRIGVHLGAAFGPAKLWPRERTVAFCRLVHEHGGQAILLGTAADDERAAAVRARAPAASVVGRDRPAVLPALLAALDGLVAGDTGVAHLAAALGTPVVALFGPTDPALTAPRGPATVIVGRAPCAPCFYRACPIEHPCLASIEPEQVWQAVIRLAAGARPAAP
jgi:heptosyltransferase-2